MNKKLKQMLMADGYKGVVKILMKKANGNYTPYISDRYIIFIPNLSEEGEVMPCIVGHGDIVGTIAPKRLNVSKGIVTNPDGILGADDRAGCYMMGELMEDNTRAFFILTDEEEVGGIGASECATSELFSAITPYISAFIELDRENKDHIATYGYDNNELIGLFEQRGYKEETGSYTDVVDFSEATDIACINLSVGYYNQHTSKEYLVLSECYATLDMMKNNMPVELYEKVYEVDNMDMLAVCCDICGDHTKVWRVDNVTMCSECMEYKESDSWYDYQWEDEKEHNEIGV